MKHDTIHLLYIQKQIANLQRLSDKGKAVFLTDQDEQAAILYYLQTLSESTTRLSEELRNAHPEIAWQQIRGFRNRVVHDYMNIDLELVWKILQTEITPLQSAIQTMLETLKEDDE